MANPKTNGKDGLRWPTTSERASWRHPQDRRILLPYSSAAALAVMAAGVTDYRTIATAVGLTVAEVEKLDAAEDANVRRLGVEGIPAGQFFRLRRRVRCPKCGGRIMMVPCIACTQSEAG